MIGFWKPAAPAARLPADRSDPSDRRLRRQVFAGIFIGDAADYLIRSRIVLEIFARYGYQSKTDKVYLQFPSHQP